jgi:transcriptional regulator with XRE-family HTH domain
VFHRLRARIASEVRSLRLSRGWTLDDLARQLHVSKTRLSEIERGGGSFTAEQFLLLLRLFNVPVSHFTGPEAGDSTTQIQNALARIGARHLHESTQKTPTEALSDELEVIGSAILDGSPRLITGAAAALVHNIGRLNLSRLQAQLADVGLQNRLGWIVDNALWCLDELLRSKPRDTKLLEAQLRLTVLANHLRVAAAQQSQVEDILDATIRTQRTLENTRKARSPIAERWNVVTSIQPEDFLKALRASFAAD